MPVPLAGAHPWRDLERRKNECPVRFGDQQTGTARALCFPFPCTGTNHTSSLIFLTKLLQHHPKLLSQSSRWGALSVFSLAGGSFQEGIFAGCSSSLPKLHVESAAVHKAVRLTPKQVLLAKWHLPAGSDQGWREESPAASLLFPERWGVPASLSPGRTQAPLQLLQVRGLTFQRFPSIYQLE